MRVQQTTEPLATLDRSGGVRRFRPAPELGRAFMPLLGSNGKENATGTVPASPACIRRWRETISPPHFAGRTGFRVPPTATEGSRRCLSRIGIAKKPGQVRFSLASSRWNRDVAPVHVSNRLSLRGVVKGQRCTSANRADIPIESGARSLLLCMSICGERRLEA